METIKLTDITGGMPTLQQQVDAIDVYIRAYVMLYRDGPDPHLELLNRRLSQIEEFIEKCWDFGIDPEIRLI